MGDSSIIVIEIVNHMYEHCKRISLNDDFHPVTSWHYPLMNTYGQLKKITILNEAAILEITFTAKWRAYWFVIFDYSGTC